MLTRAVSCHREACLDACGVHLGRSADGYVLENVRMSASHLVWDIGSDPRTLWHMYQVYYRAIQDLVSSACGSGCPGCGHLHGPRFISRDLGKRMVIHC